MKTRHRLVATAFLALVLGLTIVAAASAAGRSFPAVSASGAIGFQDDGVPSYAAFSVRAVGPASPGEEHQPAGVRCSSPTSSG